MKPKEREKKAKPSGRCLLVFGFNQVPLTTRLFLRALHLKICRKYQEWRDSNQGRLGEKLVVLCRSLLNCRTEVLP